MKYPEAAGKILLSLFFLFLTNCSINNFNSSSVTITPSEVLSKTITVTTTITPSVTFTLTPVPTNTNTPTSTPTPAGSVGGWIAFPYRGEVYFDEFNMQHSPSSDGSWIYKSAENLAPIGATTGFEVAWSPDGSQLVYPKLMEDGRLMLVLQKIATGEIQELGEVTAGNPTVGNIKFSPDGKWLMYTTRTATGYDEIWTLSLESGYMQRIENRAGDPIIWSNDSQNIYFHPNLYIDRLARISPNGITKEEILFPRKYRYVKLYVPDLDAVWIFDNWSESTFDNEILKLILVSLDDFSELRVIRMPWAPSSRFESSPDGRWLVGFLRSPSGNYIPHIIDTEQETGEINPVVIENQWLTRSWENDWKILAWGLDGTTIIVQGPLPDELDLHRGPTRIDGNGNVMKKQTPYMLDLATGEIIFVYAINIEGNIFNTDYFNRLKPSIYWHETPQQLPVVRTLTPTPIPTLLPGVTPSPTASPFQPLFENLVTAELDQSLDLNSYKQEGWDYKLASLNDDTIVVSGSGSWDAYFSYPLKDINANQGVLVKFKLARNTSSIIALTRGDWDTPSYRQWGLWGSITGAGPSTIISKGTDLSFAQPNVVSDMDLLPEIWHYLFLGIDENNELIQIVWNPEDPSAYYLSYYDYDDVDNEPYYFHVAGNIGEILLSEVAFYEFSGYKK